jgi:hypothetical protein
MSAAAILGIPALAVWGSAAYADLGNAAFVGLALLAILIWLESRKDGFLILAGVEIGLALSSKYTSVIDLALLGACLAWSIRRSPARTVLRALATFGFPGVLIAAPWYIKNWVWLGSPIFPAILIPGGEPSLRYILNTSYVQQGFGTGRQIFDYLLLPLHLYSQSLRYGQYSLEMPSIVFPLLLLWFTVGRGTPKLFLALGVARFGLWSVSSQQSRFLLPCYLFLAIATAQAVKDSNLTRRPLPGFFVRSLMSGMVAVAVAAGLVRVASSQPWRPILGLESRRQFLTRALAGFPTREYIRQNLPPDALVFLIGDGRRYYCPQQCAKEVDQFGWTRIAIESDFQAQTAASLMCAQGVTHVLLSWPDINYLLLHDWDGSITDSMRFLITDFEPTMLRQVYRETDASLFALDCISLTQLPQPGAYLSPGLVEASLPGGMFHQAPGIVGSRDRSSEIVAQ